MKEIALVVKGEIKQWSANIFNSIGAGGKVLLLI